MNISAFMNLMELVQRPKCEDRRRKMASVFRSPGGPVPSLNFITFSSLIILFVLPFSGNAQAVLSKNTTTALHRGIYELSLNTVGEVGNPYYNITFEVTFTRPDGSEVTVDGFYDGGATFKARAYCDTPGQWQWSSSANNAGLNSKSGTFEVLPSDLKGKLQMPKGNFSVKWFDPDTGAWYYDNNIESDQELTIKAPGIEDWVLVLEKI